MPEPQWLQAFYTFWVFVGKIVGTVENLVFSIYTLICVVKLIQGLLIIAFGHFEAAFSFYTSSESLSRFISTVIISPMSIIAAIMSTTPVHLFLPVLTASVLSAEAEGSPLSWVLSAMLFSPSGDTVWIGAMLAVGDGAWVGAGVAVGLGVGVGLAVAAGIWTVTVSFSIFTFL